MSIGEKAIKTAANIISLAAMGALMFLAAVGTISFWLWVF